MTVFLTMESMEEIVQATDVIVIRRIMERVVVAMVVEVILIADADF